MVAVPRKHCCLAVTSYTEVRSPLDFLFGYPVITKPLTPFHYQIYSLPI